MTATYLQRRSFISLACGFMAGTVLGVKPVDPVIGMFDEMGLWQPLSSWTTPRTPASANAMLEQAAREAYR